MAAIAKREAAWFHVDGAFGALGMLAPDIAPRLAGIEQADSIAFDFHKWGQVPYDAGFILVRDGAQHRAAFFRQIKSMIDDDTRRAARKNEGALRQIGRLDNRMRDEDYGHAPGTP